MAAPRFLRCARNVAPGTWPNRILPVCSGNEHTTGMVRLRWRKLVIMATVRARPASARKTRYSSPTRDDLVRSAVALFTTHGYAGTSLDVIAARARVTKGALYHHFRDKQDLFEAAFSAVEKKVYAKLKKVLATSENLWVKAGLVVREYLQSCLDPAYQRIVIHEGPVVMG